jgi:hypothetical protein
MGLDFVGRTFFAVLSTHVSSRNAAVTIGDYVPREDLLHEPSIHVPNSKKPVPVETP